MISPARFATGMTFDEYVRYTGTPENLAREAGSWRGIERRDFSGVLRAWYTRVQLSPVQMDAIRWLVAQPGGPARVLVISEEWSSDCRRDVPALARLAEAGGLELRIFPRDGRKLGRGPRANPDESPTADIVNALLNEKDGQTFQSVPVAAFFTRDWRCLYRHVEFPAIYHKERLYTAMQVPRPGESREQAWERFLGDWLALQLSPFFLLWASATIDEILSALHERIIVGAATGQGG
ncbi:MAG TPA: thioredoxin family protein [Methylomirabilota bacterium]|nr:thioredoxin family protein [Methylomirabilota bacterium]